MKSPISIVKSLSLVLAVALMAGCSMIAGQMGAETEVKVKLSSDVNTSESDVVVFPVMLATGNFAAANSNFGNKAMDGMLLKAWNDNIEGTVYPLPKEVMKKLPMGWEATALIIRGMEATSGLTTNETLETFFEKVKEVAGDGAIAVGLTKQSEAEYKANGKLDFNMGLYDIKSGKFKWISNAKSTQNAMVPYEVALQGVISASFEKVLEKNGGTAR